MKKIFTMILLAAGILSFNAASAQSRNDRYNSQSRYPASQSYGDRNYGGQHQSADYGYNNRQGRNDNNRRQQEFDRMNLEYGRRIDGYRHDRSLSSYERNRRIQQAEYERQQKAKAFGGGLVVGGIAAILLGAIIAHGQ